MSKFIDEVIKNDDLLIYNDVYKNLEPDEVGFYIGEKLNVYGSYKIGDIVYVSKYKNKNVNKHLFVIVDEENRGIDIDYFCMLISSKLDKLKYESNVLLKKDNMNNLNKDSIVKTDKTYLIEHNDIDFSIGKIDESLIDEFKRIYLKSKKGVVA